MVLFPSIRRSDCGSNSNVMEKMWLTKIAVCAVLAVAVTALNLEEPLEKDDIIETVNSAKTTWTAGRNFHPLATKKYVRSLLGWKKHDKYRKSLPKYEPDYEFVDLPKNFDSRQKWNFCEALQTIRDQGDCGCCWAMSSASVFTNRLCIATNGSWNGYLAAQQIVSCSALGDGCEGGSAEFAFQYFQDTGLVTGGDYNSHVGCKPYKLPNCDHETITGKYKPCGDTYKVAPACQHKCYNKKYKTPYAKDFHKVKSSFNIGGITRIQQEIYKNGPLVACFDVYEDFVSYKTGVYQHTTGDYLGGHCVQMIGWGVENGTAYWLIANQWNTDFGDKGTIKFIRGKNDCDIESDVVGGIPDV